MVRPLLAAMTLCVAFATDSRAQDAANVPARDAIAKLAWLEGEWRGVGAMHMGPGVTHRANQYEKVYRAAGGTVLAIQGIGTAADPGVPPNTVVHDAFAVIAWDQRASRYTMRSHVANGHSIDATVEVGDRRVVWGFEHPQAGRMRYTIVLTPAGEWHETGERSGDGGVTWTKVMEMTLRKG